LALAFAPVVVVVLIDLTGCTGFTTPARANMQVGKKEFFNANKV
jgi:hypothetical protein